MVFSLTHKQVVRKLEELWVWEAAHRTGNESRRVGRQGQDLAEEKEQFFGVRESTCFACRRVQLQFLTPSVVAGKTWLTPCRGGNTELDVTVV